MATIIQIKRSSGTSAPSTLKLGELAYTYGTGTQGNLGDRLFVGEGGVDGEGNANNITVIGGQYFTDQLDHAQGTLTASSALLVDSNKAIDEIFIGNNASTGGTLKLNEGTNNGTNFIGLKAPNSVTTSTTFTLPDGDGSNGQFLKTDGSGNLSFSTISSTITLAADSGADDTYTTGNTLTFTGGTGIDTTVSDDTITIAVDATIATASSSTTFTNKTFDANGTGNSISNLEVADFASGVIDTDISSVSASDDTLASAKAIKAYVDSQVTAIDVDIAADTGTIAITDAETLTFTGGTGIDTSATGNAVTFAIDSSVTTNTGTQTLTNKTIDSASNTLTLDLSEGTLTGTTAEFNTALSDANFVIQDGSGNVTVSGDLTVNGTTTTVASTNTTIADNLLELNSGATSNANDAGLLIERGSTGDNAIIAWDESADKFVVGTTTATSSDTGDLTIATATLVANVEGNLTGDVTGDVTGNADTATLAADATTLATPRTIAGQSFDGSANITIASTDLSDTADIALLTATQTLTNKTIAAGSNTISGLTSSHFASAVTLVINDSTGTAVKTIVGSAS